MGGLPFNGRIVERLLWVSACSTAELLLSMYARMKINPRVFPTTAFCRKFLPRGQRVYAVICYSHKHKPVA